MPKDLSIGGGILVAGENAASREVTVDFHKSVGAALERSRGPAKLALLFHRGFEALEVQQQAPLLRKLARQVQREAVGIIKAEDIVAGQSLLAPGQYLFHRSIEPVQSGGNCLLEVLLFVADGLFDEVPTFHKLGIMCRP